MGAVDPGGKLPITFPADATQFPTYDPNCTDTSATGNCPLYPGMVGYGLSYTKFDYSKLQVQASADGGVDVSFRIRNVGPYTGSDTPQVYVGPSSQLSAGTQQAVRKLVQFQRVALTSGHAADLTLHVSAQSLSSWSTAQQKWVLGTGARSIYVGPSSRDLPLQATVTVGS